MNDIIIKYLQGNASEEEKKEFLDWLKQSGENKKIFSEIRDIWLTTGTSPASGPHYLKAAFRRFTENVNELDRRKTFLQFNFPLKVAASVAILLICSLGGYFAGHTNALRQTGETGMLVMNQAIMGQGSKGSVTLPDGTVAWLNENSKLVYPEHFAAGKRQVKLEGEAYFEVVRDEKAPFYVETDDMVVNVLGTRFDVKNYVHKETVEATLISGKVKVFFPDSKEGIVLEPNQKISCNRQTGDYRLTEVNASEYILWINEKLVCTNETLSAVLHKMKLWYDIDIECDAGVSLNQHISLTIRKESPNEIFKLLELISPISCTIAGDKVYVKRK